MSNKPRVVLIYTSDTKQFEGAYLRDCLEQGGVDVVHIDPSIRPAPDVGAEIPPTEIAAEAGHTLEQVRDLKHEGKCQAVMTDGVCKRLSRLYAEDNISGVLAVGGSMGTGLACTAMQQLPFGLPKMMISTMASGFTRPYVGTRDIIMSHSVADISGLNTVTRSVFRNACMAMAGMANNYQAATVTEKPLVLISTLGTTELCSKRVRQQLESQGCEAVTFHTTGTGGAALDEIATEQDVACVVDMSLVEINDFIAGGMCSAGPDRAKAALRAGRPVIFAPGNVDFIIGGPIAEARVHFPGKKAYHEHNPALTAIRTDESDLRKLVEHIAGLVREEASGPVSFFVPLKGFSNHDSPAGYLLDTTQPPILKRLLDEIMPSSVEVVAIDAHINDTEFADALAAAAMKHCAPRIKS